MSITCLSFVATRYSTRAVSQFLPHLRHFHKGNINNTLILERFYEVPLPKIGRPPKLKRRHNIYKVVDKINGPKELTVILTKDSLEHGVSGEVVTLVKHLARDLLKQSEAVYASPENLQEIATSIGSKSQQSDSGRRMILWLSNCGTLKCPMRTDIKWTMTPELLSRALQRTHGLVTTATSLALPEYPITSKGSLGEHEIVIMVNQLDPVSVKIDLVPWEAD